MDCKEEAGKRKRVELKKDLPIVETAHFLNENGPFLSGGVSNALFHDVAGELVLGQSQHFASHAVNKLSLILGLSMLCEREREKGRK